ncbi:LysR family transcriptional regulator [Amaricoccus macauensis]|uniref:LysR family transcriptional regulator n=1 Tax=Amaricoccus macauensis TaxID=57001 RepID=UPI003C7E7379
MPRNLDITALRSFVAVADAKGVTKAASQLNLTQSAVSMQLKRLEESFGQDLLDRSGRQIALTVAGDQLLGYARKMVSMNDETWGRMTNQAFEGEINFGVPHDVIYPHVPRILQRFNAEYPRIRVQLHSLYTSRLRVQIGRGEMDLILATEEALDPGGETLATSPLVWSGAQGGQAWRHRPVRFASVSHCLFRRPAIEALEREGIPWENGIDSISDIAVEASVSADLAISVQLEASVPRSCEIIRHGGALPVLPEYQVNMYVCEGPRAVMAERLAAFVRQAYGASEVLAAE